MFGVNQLDSCLHSQCYHLSIKLYYIYIAQLGINDKFSSVLYNEVLLMAFYSD